MLLNILIFAAVLVALGIYVLTSLQTIGWRRWAGPIGYIIVSLALLFALSQSLGGCVPRWLVFTKVGIMSVIYDEPNAIYFWANKNAGFFDLDPVCIRIPWEEEKARKVRETEQESEGNGLEMEPDAFGWGTGWYDEEGEMPLHPKPVTGSEIKEDTD